MEINKIAKEIAKLSPVKLDELTSALLAHDISATIYRFGTPTDYSDISDIKYGVFISKTGDRKLLLLKTIKELFEIGLKEAKDIVDSCPCVIKELSYELAEGLKNELEECGATVEIREI